MQIRSIILYSKSGEKRVLDFRLGELNIVTGTSQTGKSALLDIVDFCLGRDEATLPISPIFNTVSWYAVILQLPDTRVLAARPAPRPGAKSVTNAMLEVGNSLGVPELADLRVNTDSTQLRQQLGRRIGIGATRSESPSGSLLPALSANLGHAVLLCLQNQDEVASKRSLFHRQNERGIPESLKATIPYFLGAVPEDQAVLQHQLTQAKRALRRAEHTLKAAQETHQGIEARLESLLGEARVHGLLTDNSVTSDRAAAVAALQQAVSFQSTRGSADEDQRRQELRLTEQTSALRRQLRSLAEERQLLNDLETQAAGYTGAVARGISRLSALDLVPDSVAGEHSCPLCGHDLPEPDPTVADMHTTLSDLRGQLDSVQTVNPRREQALREIEQTAARLREQLQGIEGALSIIAEQRNQQAGLLGQAEAQAFTRGRISAYLSQISTASNRAHLQNLESDVAVAQRLVQGLEEQLDAEAIDDRLTHSISYLSGKMTGHARTLRLEHGDRLVRLDLKKLTVVADTLEGITELLRIGSGKNHVGYHVAAHLALHQYFVANSRPVPRFLMLDQPTQPYYPSDMAKQRGRLEDIALDEDRVTVTRLFELMHEVTTELSPNFQMIVSDHADLPHPWFQDSVRYNWRNGEKLIPTTWLNDNPTR
ncbi:yme-like protein [Streptomyces xiamenensis]|uniref:Yme-like protein n=1 Tax=Streptomyces xiamenensis TaxID=408015 RepID=A0A0F7FNL6_9ACTN|nr:DUF3732 domain-containing protein [Streptomyces xiamenensis]AKG41393.1 yme-like protein [Streptomyces xiamenensis]